MVTTRGAPARVLLAGSPDALPRVRCVLDGQAWPYALVRTPVEALRHLRSGAPADLVLLVPGEADEAIGIYGELCRAIKFDERSRFVAVVFVVAARHEERIPDILGAGADDCIRCVASEREILLRLAKALATRQATDSLEDAAAVVTSLANAVEGKDRYTCGHVDRVSAYSVHIGRRLGLGPEDLAALKTGGAVHDIGKVGIPDPILNKPGKLSDDEMAIMRRHPALGYEILKPLRTFQSVLPIVRWHHEKPNGRGYPDNLLGEQIPLLARITAVADVFDALSTDRPYRAAFPLPQCRTFLLSGAADGELDGVVVRAMLEILENGLKVLSAA